MRCPEVLERLGGYADGELAAPLAQALEEHLRACPSCEARHRALRGLGALLTTLPAEEAPEGLERAILEAARFRAPRPAPVRHPALALAGRVAAALLIALSGLYLGLRLSAVQQASAAPPAAAAPGDPLSPDTAPFQLVPPDSPGALCLALAAPEAP